MTIFALSSAPGQSGVSVFRISGPESIFIVGMPRSGTSMLEQIIASHKLGSGLGEPRDISILFEDLCFLHEQEFPHLLKNVSPSSSICFNSSACSSVVFNLFFDLN